MKTKFFKLAVLTAVISLASCSKEEEDSIQMKLLQMLLTERANYLKQCNYVDANWVLLQF
jgi:hypothetical protein